MIKQIIPHGSGFYALTDAGEIYSGFFVQHGDEFSSKPKFGWRKVPPIPEDVYEFKPFEELTAFELAALKKKNKNK